MDVKFNSLFDGEDMTQDQSKMYLVDTLDETLLLSKLVLGEDVGKRQAIEKLEARTFGNYPNYLLSGRPCATRGCPPEKFCESSGWPESPVFKPKNPCEMPFAPNSQRGDPNLWARNIEMEAKLRNIDFIDSKCHLKKHKEDPCINNPEACPLSCHKNKVSKDYMLPKENGKQWDVDIPERLPTISDGIKRVQANKRQRCEKMAKQIIMASNMRHFMPTKRRDTVKW
jgi:hypothetical protein